MLLFIRLTTLIFLLIGTSNGQHNPLKDPNICGRPTCKDNGKFKYKENTEQNYKYTVDIKSLFNGTSRNESNIKIEGSVTLNFISGCDGLLTLSDFKLIQDDRQYEDEKNRMFGEALEEYNLRFDFHDGIISEICPADDEKVWVLNFKKGILSLLHNTMKRFDLDYTNIEDDVSGNCLTDYRVIGAKETSLIIEKIKYLNSCKSRSKLHSIIQSTPYEFHPKFQQQENLLNSSSKCELSIDHNIYNRITCKEVHILQAFSNRDSGATTYIKQELTLVSEHVDRSVEQNEITKRTSLHFDHSPSYKIIHDDSQKTKTEDLIRSMCKSSTDDVQIEFSDLFTRFIQTLRILPYTSLSDIYDRIGTICTSGKKHLLDGLPNVGTTASMRLMKYLIVKNEIPENTIREWLLSFAFIARPDGEMIKIASELLVNYDTDRVLSVSSLAHTFCTQHAHCLDVEGIGNIVDFIQNEILSILKEEKNEIDQYKLIVLLKGLSNIGVIREGFNRHLEDIIEARNLQIETRLAAVESFRRLPCNKYRNFFEKLYRDDTYDPEIRITAYLQMMKCPDYLMMRTIKRSLQIEEVNQVSSFVWTHLKNLLKSSNPSRVEIQSLLSDMDLVKKFSSDIRKFSHNREGSIFFEEYNVGANYENNIIFSPSSYIPRTAMFNFSIELFGKSINVLELYGRAEGFEHYFESLFGPKSPYAPNKLQDRIQKLRLSRSIASDETLKNKIEKLPNVSENLYDHPKVSLGMKIFGNELRYETFDGAAEILAALRTLNPVDHLKKILSGKEINYNKATMFLDTSYAVPSGAGLPISLNAIGTASVNLKLFGFLHASDFSKKAEFDLRAEVRPSVSIDVTGKMSVDAFYANTEIQIKSSIYTSSAIEGYIKIRGAKLVSIKFSIPRQTTEIFGAKTELYVTTNGIAHRQRGLDKYLSSKSICSWPAVDKTVGLKLCGDYHFINVTKINIAPYFPLAGPSGIRLFLEKSDPTAKIYLFEYEYVDGNDSSHVSLTFDTSGSELRRLLAANFTIDKQTQNLTLLMQSSAGKMLAKGRYKNSDDEKFLQVALDINDKKHFDTSLVLIRQESNHGYIYHPKVYLGVNGERVLDLQGTLKLISKKGISQYDVDLKFQTKRLTSKLFGYISKSDASVATNMKLDYKFVHTKEQRINFDFSLANRSPKHMLDIRGACSLSSTAYPYYNFDANLKFQRGSGPIECKFDLYSNPLPANHPDALSHQLKIEWLFSYKSLPDTNPTLNTVLSINRESAGLNLKGQFTYEVRGPTINIASLIKYAKDKEVTMTVFWYHPRGTLEEIEGRINITFPSFTSLILQGKLQEKEALDYIVELKGVWFSGHSISARGFYQDKSTARSLNHHLKLLLKSPSFQDINTDLQFYRDNDELKIDLKADQDGNDYNLFFKHTYASNEGIDTEIKIKYQSKVYSMNSWIYFGDHRRISLQFHIDQIRDIQFAVWEYNKETYKAAGLEVKWDANRDNNQKLVISGNFTKIGSLNYEGNLLMSYPGRTVLANFKFHLDRGHFNTLVRLSWSDHQSFAISVAIDYDGGNKTYFLLDSKIVTPFQDWKRTSINGGYHHKGNMYHLDGKIFWKLDQHITIDLYEDYALNGTEFECEFRSSLTSTLKNVPTLSATFNHSHNESRISSIGKFMYSKEHVIGFKSNWQIDKDKDCVNLTGTVVANTPFKGFNRGYLINKIHLTKSKYIRGFADLDLDHKKFIVSLEGHLEKITNSMLEINVTTPIRNYDKLQGKFGLSEKRKYLVAEVLYPNGSVGIEILLSLNSIIDFDVKFKLGTHLTILSFLQRVLLIGRLNSHQADFRLGWNQLVVGFNGVWRYANIFDFEYLYKIYTPIEGFEENGIVTKLIFKEGLDFEVSIKLSEHKLGLVVSGHPKPKLLKELGIRTESIYNEKLEKPNALLEGKNVNGNNDGDEEEEDEEDDDDDDDDPLSWTGLIKIDPLIYPTMEGTLDIDQEGSLYILQGKLSLPDGLAELEDEFDFISIYEMENRLQLTTPYKTFKTLNSYYRLLIVPHNEYVLNFNFNYQNNTRWIETKAFARYAVGPDGNGKEIYNATFQVNTPLQTFPQLNVQATHEKDENTYISNFLMITNKSDILLNSNLKINGNLYDSFLLLRAKTPSMEIPPTNITFKSNIRSDDNLMDLNINIPKVLNKDIRLITNWFYSSKTKFYAIVRMHTPFRGMTYSYAGLNVSLDDVRNECWMAIRMHPLEIETNTILDDNIFLLISNINFNGKSFPLNLTSSIVHVGSDRRNFIGNLNLKDKLFRVTGTVYLLGQIPVETHFKLIPEDGSDPLDFEYKLNSNENSYAIVGNIKHATKYATFNANMIEIDTSKRLLNLQIDTSNKQYSKFMLDAEINTNNRNMSVAIDARTPLPKLENVKLGASISATDAKRTGTGYFEITEAKGDIKIDWIWTFMETMYLNAVGYYQNDKYNSTSKLEGFYLNPERTFESLKLGGSVDIDTLWSTSSNLTLSLKNHRDVSFEGHLKLPPPHNEVHSLISKLYYERNLKAIEYLAKYQTNLSNKKYGSWGNVLFVNNTEMGGNFDVIWNDKHISNHMDLQEDENKVRLTYKLRTPKYDDQYTFVSRMSYGVSKPYYNLTCELFYPEKQAIGNGKIDFKEFGNMNGTINVTFPYQNVTYRGVSFDTKTNAYIYKRYVEVFWENDTAVLDCKCNTKRGHSLLESNTTGILLLSIPLTTRHTAKINFDYLEKPQVSTGWTIVNYNGNRILEGKYNCLSESQAGFTKHTIHAEVENKLVPIGADYIQTYEYGPTGDGFDVPTVDGKYLHLYHLKNLSKFNVSGEMNVRTTTTGRQIAFAAIHSNRTIKLRTNYDVLNQQFKQNSRLELSPSTWIEYDLDLFNATLDEDFDAQKVQINVSYPYRNFTASGSYNISDTSVTTDVSLVWDKDNKTVQAGFDWRRLALNREEFQFLMKHPTFERDVVFFGEYERNDRYINGEMTVNYSNDPERTLNFGAKFDDNTEKNFYNYTYNIWAMHDATNLNLNSYGGFYWNPFGYNTGHYSGYKRSYLPLQTAEALLRIDLVQNEMEIKKETGHKLSYLWTKYNGSFPIYTANLSTSHEMNNASGEFYMNFEEKLVRVNYNMTTDGSQSLHMYGYIPDARSAIFNIWRDYEDIKVSDVGYYLRMNHSRLIMSSMKWRPDLVSDIQSGIRNTLKDIYSNILDGINNTKQYIRYETNDAIHGIWNDAKPFVQNLLDDLKELKLIEQDFEELKIFLNKFYDANEFYIKDITNITMSMFDELAIKSHIQSLPAIVGEIWEVMGESGTKIKKSIVWVIEKIKTYYKNTTKFIHELLDGDPIDHVSEVLKTVVKKYDDFIKDIHVAFIKYMENLWKETYNLIISNWHKTLVAIEPTFIKFAHYVETIVWNTSKEFLDFLYIRKSELIESPYFAKFTNFTHDLDKFYKDITGDNTISSIIKYTKVAWNFLKEKYFSLVPFGKELQDVVSEIFSEINELRNLPSIQYLCNKFHILSDKAEWLYDYFDIENRLHKFISLLHSKLTDMSQTALQTENRYREAKTKFIFEPNDGVMHLEQKLPMSWHAFNETPKFQEIPEIKFIYDLQNYFVVTQASFWDFYYDYIPYTDISGWLPPFKAQAMLVGTRYYVTFDRRHYDFHGSSSYLLATDYVDRNFSIVVSYDDKAKETHQLLVLIDGTVIRIDIFSNVVKIDGNQEQILPLQIGNTYIYRETDILYVKSTSSDFELECNMKFHVCLFDVSGWYFGKTAGLWGTINNEPYDDLLMSNRTRAKSDQLDQFVASWCLDDSPKCNDTSKIVNGIKRNDQIVRLCEEFFLNKVSQFATCFERVPKAQFLTMCLDSVTRDEACTSAVAYVNLCALSNTPLRIPDVCVKCNTTNGTLLNEGNTMRLDGGNLPQSADVVFVIEAKACNDKLKTKKNLDLLIELIHKELHDINVTNNRYALVVFGGDGVYNEPRSVIFNNEIFTDFKLIIPYLDTIPLGNGNTDIFAAILYASRLLYRAGVSKNIILLPCSKCHDYNMKLDYAIVHQLLLENDIVLHILMNEEFSLQKMRENKIPFGIDRIQAYTKKDIRGLKGDAGLRKQVTLPKFTLGHCTPLALETNGTIFSAKYLETDKKNMAKKFAGVFAKRIAFTAKPNHCVECECTAFNTGVSYMECHLCIYPTRASIDYLQDFDENEALSIMQPAEEFLFGDT